MTPPMRMLVAMFLPLSGLLGACQSDCGLPNTVLDGRQYRAFGNVIDYTVGQTGAPPGDILVNGHTTLEFQWGGAAEGPVSVLIDGQAFEGEGYWNPVECNNFSVSFGGTFQSAEGTAHNFTAAANFFAFTDVYFGELVEGSVAWNETWTTADGQGVGQLQVVDSAVNGRLQ